MAAVTTTTIASMAPNLITQNNDQSNDSSDKTNIIITTLLGTLGFLLTIVGIAWLVKHQQLKRGVGPKINLHSATILPFNTDLSSAGATQEKSTQGTVEEDSHMEKPLQQSHLGEFKRSSPQIKYKGESPMEKPLQQSHLGEAKGSSTQRKYKEDSLREATTPTARETKRRNRPRITPRHSPEISSTPQILQSSRVKPDPAPDPEVMTEDDGGPWQLVTHSAKRTPKRSNLEPIVAVPFSLLNHEENITPQHFLKSSSPFAASSGRKDNLIADMFASSPLPSTLAATSDLTPTQPQETASAAVTPPRINRILSTGAGMRTILVASADTNPSEEEILGKKEIGLISVKKSEFIGSSSASHVRKSNVGSYTDEGLAQERIKTETIARAKGTCHSTGEAAWQPADPTPTADTAPKTATTEIERPSPSITVATTSNTDRAFHTSGSPRRASKEGNHLTVENFSPNYHQ